MFRPYELIEYIDYFDQNAYRDDINKVDEEAIIDDIQDSNQDHCIIQSL